MIKNALFIASLFACLLFFTRCLEPIAFQSTTVENSLVVNGRLNNLRESQIVYLSQTRSFSESPAVVTDAKLTLIRQDDGRRFGYTNNFYGTYSLDNNTFSAEIGKTYLLEIVLSSGKKYLSDPETMPDVVTPDSLHLAVERETSETATGEAIQGDALNLYVSTPLLPNGKVSYLRWYTEFAFQYSSPVPAICGLFPPPYSAYYFIKQSLAQKIVLASSKTGLTRLDNARVGSEFLKEDYRYNEICYFNVFQQSITPAAYAYWQKVALLSQQNGSIFDVTPSSVTGNIHNTANMNEKVLGYFEVAAVSNVQKRITSSDITPYHPLVSKPQQCTTAGSLLFASGACCNAYLLPLTTGETRTSVRPTYWR